MSLTQIRDKKILLSALDWGMGHTTRCVALIHKLIAQGNTITFAGNENQRKFMSGEFPEMRAFHLDGYNMTLDSRRGTYRQMFAQRKKIRQAIIAESKWVEKTVANESFGTIISDNRYGFRSEKVHSVLLTHQLNLQLPWFANFVSKQLQFMINQFNECWVPDSSDRALTGDLSSATLSVPLDFIGPLCRFKQLELREKFSLLVILSGPEPERSNFEHEIIRSVSFAAEKVVIVGTKQTPPDVKCFESPSTLELQKLIAESGLVISRAGYTTLMEMCVLNKNCVLIPTKGQYEQEYLARTFRKNNIRFAEIEQIPNLIQQFLKKTA